MTDECPNAQKVRGQRVLRYCSKSQINEPVVLTETMNLKVCPTRIWSDKKLWERCPVYKENT
jgi:hypothetical protein